MNLSKNLKSTQRMSLVVCGIAAALVLTSCASDEAPKDPTTSAAGAEAEATVAPRGTLETPAATADSVEKSTRESPYICDAGENLTFKEDNMVVALMGSCGTLKLDGKGITVDAETAESVEIGGSENSAGFSNDVKNVTISGKNSIFSAGAIVSVTVSGDKNTLFADTVEKIEVSGSDNDVMLQVPSSSVKDTGKNNSIK